ncbi:MULTISPECIES: GNAT family N-acetyltransferase [unclassified Rhizobium]|uniref:GNAT family N-acetyltransferase n=1 Tax=unclassified Rhizobium TaxID=2613769 RepID=UPI0037F98213
MTVKRIEAEDAEVFHRVRLEVLGAEPASYAGSYDDWPALLIDEWKERVSEPVFVAVRDLQPIGLIGLLRQRASKMAHRAMIIIVHVRRDRRGSGPVKDLLHAVADYTRDSGIRQLGLIVGTENPAASEEHSRQAQGAENLSFILCPQKRWN